MHLARGKEPDSTANSEVSFVSTAGIDSVKFSKAFFIEQGTVQAVQVKAANNTGPPLQERRADR